MGINIEGRHVTLFVYNLGVLVTGMGVGSGGRPALTPITISFLAALAVGWTVYFNWRLGPDFFATLEEDEDDEPDRHPME